MTNEEYNKHRHNIRYKLRDEQGDKCHYCGCNFAPGNYSATIDHIVPKIDGGTNEDSNLVAACTRCNHHKAEMSENDFRLILCLRRYDDLHKDFLPEPPQHALWSELPNRSFNVGLSLQILEKINAGMKRFDDKKVVEKILVRLIEECIESKIIERGSMKKFLVPMAEGVNNDE